MLFGLCAQAQTPWSFRPPLDIPLVLAGTFGELRSNHFHSGVDIKTQGRTGFPVLAIDDAQVVRVKVSPTGYGKAIYLKHSNGYTSVYAHLEAFSPEIEAYVKEQQYAKKSFAVNLFPPANTFLFEKGDTIGLSGNTGGSTAPHLHFEIRDSRTEEPLNPLKLGLDIADNRPPQIKSIYLYALDSQMVVIDKQRFAAKKSGPNQFSIGGPLNLAEGNYGLAIETYDRQDGAYNKNGAYSIELRLNNALWHLQKMDRFGFHETRYINSLIDYEEKFCCRHRPQKSFIEPNNQLSIYQKGLPGTFYLTSDSTLVASYRVMDAAGNYSNISIQLRGTKTINSKSDSLNQYKLLLSPFEAFHFETEDLDIHFPKNCFYTRVPFSYAREVFNGNLIHVLAPIYKPIHERFELVFHLPNLSDEERKKTILRHWFEPEQQDQSIALTGAWEKDYFKVSSRQFGRFCIDLDTLAPVIERLNIHEGITVNPGDELELIAYDQEVGIKRYEAFLDDQWILLSYDPKHKRFNHTFEDRFQTNAPRMLTIVLEDFNENIAVITKQINF